MTSQHFAADADGWDNWGNDWGDQNSGEANNNNNSKIQSSQQLPVNQPFMQSTVASTPVYNPFAYSQSNAPMPIQPPMPPPPVSTQSQQIQQQQPQQHPQMNSNIQPQAHYQQNPVNFFNPSAHFDSTNNNPMSSFSSIQSPIPSSATTLHSPFNSPQQQSQPSMMNYSQSETQNVSNAHYQPPTSYESPSYPPPPPVLSYEDVKNYNATPPTSMVQQQPTPPPPVATFQQNQFSNQQWSDQRNVQSNEMTYNMQQQYQNWQSTSMSQYSHQQPIAASSNSSNDWERISPDSVQFLQQQTQSIEQPKKSEETQMFTASPQVNQVQVAKVENVENIQTPAVEAQNTVSSYPPADQYENRERLDEVPSLRPPSSSSSIERHNYLVTGQLSSESSPQFQNQNISENLPPPGLSRMVVGEPESNQEQVMPSAHRMVTGNEMTPASYLNYQRQADGEAVSPMNVVAPVRPPSHPPYVHHEEPQSSPQQQNFNVGDRNLYLVAGESNNMNSQQRVIPGVESDNSMNNLPSVINPLQNLHIEDDDDFVNISVSSQHRNVDGDGMEEQEIQQRPSVETTEQREEDIEGANDNIAENAAISMPIQPEHEPLEIREDIEGANDPGEPLPPAKIESEPKKSLEKKRQESSEDSELREVERNAKLKPRRSKKYDSNYSDSENDDEYRKRDKYDDRYKKSSRDRMTREEYEKYRRREKERRSGGNSRHGESRRRTDDEDEGRRVRGDKNRSRDYREDVDGEYKEKRKDKRREGESRRKDYDDDRDRRDRRRRDRYYDEDYPSTSGRRSQNTSDREFDRYSRRSRGAYEQPYQNYGYDPYSSYYQQQQYFEMLRRTNPQAYEWYKNYYSMMQQQQQQQPQVPVPAATMDDIGGSLRSGYSSGTEKDRASTSRFLPGGTISNPPRSLNTSFVESTDFHSLQAPFQPIGGGFNQTYPSSLNYGYDMYSDLRQKPEPVAPSRMTPWKFQCLHGYVNLSNGLMATIDTFNADNRYLLKIENVPIYDRKRRLYQSYPGPLVRGVSHKKTVIEFCEDKLKQNTHIESSLRASYNLLWSYLILMLRQNGTYTEADISELLMKNSDEFKNSLETSVAENTEEVDDNTDVSDSEDASEKNSNSASHSQETTQSQSVPTEKNVLDKFKSYLLYGNINDALDYATDNNLWGHALFLASKVDRRQHANVMLKFANKLPYNDPLQTLYQIMSGRMPACVSNLDDKWGDWRPHLAMIISNCTDKPDLVKRSIIALGDSLASRGDVYGSQFCYLLMDPQFTDYSDAQGANGKIGLLGTSLNKPFKEFATDDSIIMTEVYEYARSLSVEGYFIAPLQKYKFLLATNMLDYGMQLKCLLYMEQIAKCIIQRVDLFETSFMMKIYSFGDRLKFYDPVMERTYEEGSESTENQKWLQDLYAIMEGYGNVQQNQVSAVPTYSTNEIYNPVEYQQPQMSVPQGIYDPMSQHTTPVHAPQPVSQQPSFDEDQNDQQNQQINYSQDYGQYQQDSINYSYQQPQQNMSMRRESQQQEQNYLQPSYEQNYQQDYGYAGYDQSYQQPQPQITMGNAVSKTFEEKSEPEASDQKHESPVKGNKEVEKPAKKSSPSQDQGSGWFGGIFSKLSMKPKNQMILPDDKNPSIVWDEATKKWVNKDEDASEAESFKPPPKMGEMMAASMPQPQQQIPQQSIPQQPPAPTVQPSQFQPQTQMSSMPVVQQTPINPLQSNSMQTPMNALPSMQASSGEQPALPSAPNMFKMQKGRNLKKSYVDILGNAGKTVPNQSDVAPPQMDMQFFNPQAQQQGMQFYNPNDFN